MGMRSAGGTSHMLYTAMVLAAHSQNPHAIASTKLGGNLQVVSCMHTSKHASKKARMHIFCQKGFDLQPTIVIVIGSWYTGAIDSFLLKTIIEEEMGLPAVLVSDEGVDRAVAPEAWSDKDIEFYNGHGTVWPSLAKGKHGLWYMQPDRALPNGVHGLTGHLANDTLVCVCHAQDWCTFILRYGSQKSASSITSSLFWKNQSCRYACSIAHVPCLAKLFF